MTDAFSEKTNQSVTQHEDDRELPKPALKPIKVIISAAKKAINDKKLIKMYQSNTDKTKKLKLLSRHSIDSIKRGWNGR